jgi:septum formation protein
MATLLLASGSPRRRAYLEALGIPFEPTPVEVDESPRAGEGAPAYVRRLARAKARTAKARAAQAGDVVLAADTAVVLGQGKDEEILGKPEDGADAHRMLRSLSGRRHRVLTGVAVLRGDRCLERLVSTTVVFRRLRPDEIAWYVSTGEPMDKAGAYAVQGLAAWFVDRIEGSYSNVVGLPLAQTAELLTEIGVSLPWEGADPWAEGPA